jgi:hypothetical protein
MAAEKYQEEVFRILKKRDLRDQRLKIATSQSSSSSNNNAGAGGAGTGAGAGGEIIEKSGSCMFRNKVDKCTSSDCQCYDCRGRSHSGDDQHAGHGSKRRKTTTTGSEVKKKYFPDPKKIFAGHFSIK